ncbi:MAG: hypothetical protein ABW076_01525 [Candidatus Thiodiazotropha sp.]
MKPELGDPYVLEEYTLDDLKQHPILVWAVHDHIDPGMQYLTPVLNSRNLSPEYNHAKILLSVKDTDVYAEASYNAEDHCVYSILIWEGDSTLEVEDSNLDAPVVLKAIPEIDGVAGMEFRLATKEDYYAYPTT